MMTMNENGIKRFNNQSLGEEIANSIVHGIGALLAVVGTIAMIVYACLHSTVLGIVSASLYGVSMIVLYTVSTLYHSFTTQKVKRIFQILDHCSIFVLILGTYIPICLCLLEPVVGWIILGVMTVCAVVGIVLNAINLKKWHRLSLGLYLIMGWASVFTIQPMLAKLAWQSLTLLVVGGILYTVGVLFYKDEKHRFMHMVWHFFVLGGSVCHFFFILFYVLPI